MLTPEQILSNWEKFLGYIDLYIMGDRGVKLKAFYEQYSERFMMMPAAHKPQYHNCFPGGYIDHVNRVIEGALKIHDVWQLMGTMDTYSVEELVFAAMNHDLGKFGTFEQEAYLPQTDQWRKEKLNEPYMFNDRLEFMSVPDRGLYILSELGISVTKNEMLAIKLHDGLYDEANKPYLMSWMPETKPRTSLIYIVHQADLMAARIEFEREWLPKLLGFKSQETNFKLSKSESTNKSKKEPIKTKALGNVKSEGLKNVMSNFFNEE